MLKTPGNATLMVKHVLNLMRTYSTSSALEPEEEELDRLMGEEEECNDVIDDSECLSADLFTLFHMTLFNDEISDNLGLPRCTSNEKLFLKICLHGHHLLAIKKIALGDTPMMTNDDRSL